MELDWATLGTVAAVGIGLLTAILTTSQRLDRRIDRLEDRVDRLEGRIDDRLGNVERGLFELALALRPVIEAHTPEPAAPRRPKSG